jgi:hypothetical protein
MVKRDKIIITGDLSTKRQDERTEYEVLMGHFGES